MAEIHPTLGSAVSGPLFSGQLDSIRFSGYRVLIIALLAFVGFVAPIENPKPNYDAVRMP
jgi:hypothetical protein